MMTTSYMDVETVDGSVEVLGEPSIGYGCLRMLISWGAVFIDKHDYESNITPALGAGLNLKCLDNDRLVDFLKTGAFSFSGDGIGTVTSCNAGSYYAADQGYFKYPITTISGVLTHQDNDAFDIKIEGTLGQGRPCSRPRPKEKHPEKFQVTFSSTAEQFAKMAMNTRIYNLIASTLGLDLKEWTEIEKKLWDPES